MDKITSVPRSANEPTPTAPFRFFDLPAKLRLKVYEDLLTIKPSKGATTQIARHSQILRASKKFHNEAQPILERLNRVEIQIDAFALIDGSLGDHPLPHITLEFAGGLRQTLWEAFRNLPMSAGSCYDVHQRWQHTLQSRGGGGGSLCVTIGMAYHSITCNEAERLAAAIAELESQGTSHDGICDVVLESFMTLENSIAAGPMSIAELFQLAYALEHFKPTAPHFPQIFVSGRSGDYDRTINRNHAHELMTASTKPDARVIRRLWDLMAGWLPASVANFTTRTLLPRHACRWEFRRDIRLLEINPAQFKARPQRSFKLPYTRPPVVWRLLPWVECFLKSARAVHMQEGTRRAVGKL
jgi:hypothetical protein